MAKKKIERLRLGDAVERLDKMIGLINTDVQVALGLEASLEAANQIVTEKLSDVQFDGADCYNALRQSTALFLALTLAKLFEVPSLRKQSKATRYNKSDVASIPLLVRLLDQRRCRQALVKRARDWTPMMPNMADTHAKSCARAIDRAVEAYAAFRRKHAGRSAAAKLRRFRDKVLAHTLLGTALKKSPMYSEMFLLMDVARQVTEHARLAISGLHVDLVDTEEHLAEISRAFWEPALIAVTKIRR